VPVADGPLSLRRRRGSWPRFKPMYEARDARAMAAARGHSDDGGDSGRHYYGDGFNTDVVIGVVVGGVVLVALVATIFKFRFLRTRRCVRCVHRRTLSLSSVRYARFTCTFSVHAAGLRRQTDEEEVCSVELT